jgi:methylmalonyl-CoA/ethylmalonyl-CoA epimerase
LTDIIFEMDHIGWAVNSIENASAAFEALGFEKCGDVCDDEQRNVRILMMKQKSGASVELVTPYKDANSPVSNFLLKNGPAPYHCCFATGKEGSEKLLKSLKKAGFNELIKASPAPALGGDDVIFLYSGVIGLVELVLRD